MQKFVAYIVSTLALMSVLIPITIAEDNQNGTANLTLNQTQNATGNITLNEAQNANQQTRVLRAGFENTKPLDNLGAYGNKSASGIPAGTANKTAFDLSQRLGNVSKFTYNTDIYTPVYNVSQYSRTKPIYEAPGNLASRPVYNISGQQKNFDKFT